VKLDEMVISKEYLNKAADTIIEQLGHHGIEKVGGKTWWQWRRPGNEMKAEWIEMRKDYNERQKNKDPGRRVMLYVHGGAYFAISYRGMLESSRPESLLGKFINLCDG
jgi:acetyl esterase/lipase